VFIPPVVTIIYSAFSFKSVSFLQNQNGGVMCNSGINDYAGIIDSDCAICFFNGCQHKSISYEITASIQVLVCVFVTTIPYSGGREW